MRLTLRTLLAYVDDILEPADHEELGKKIESSDFATELIHRSRDTVRRLRLGAPPVHAEDSQDVLGGEMTVDANTVSEYLDNTLPPERVADYERVCLEPGTEADIHLAEVASCHHVLTMVLGEPAEISTEVRERMYNLPEELERRKTLRIEPAHQPAPQPAPPAPPVGTPIAPVPPAEEVVEREQEVPDYLRAAAQQRNLRVRLMAVACILMMIAGLGAFLFWPVDDPELPADLAQNDADQAVADLAIDIEPAPGEAALASESGSEAPPFVPEEPPAEEATDVPPVAEPALPADDIDTSVAADIPPLDDTLTPLGPTEDATATSDVESTTASVTDVTLPTTVPPPPVGDAGPGSGALTVPPDPVDVLPTEGGSSGLALDSDDDVEDPSEESFEDEQPAGPMRVGSYLGGSSYVLLRRDEQGRWVRLPPRSAILAGDHLLSLPTFRPHVSLEEANVYMAGGTQLFFAEPDAFSGEPAVDIDILYGRLLINAGLKGGPLVLEFGEQQRRIVLGGSAGLALEVRRLFEPGSNLEQEAAPTEVSWYLTSGSIQWPGQAGGMQTITAPATWNTFDGIDELATEIVDLPEWIDREKLTESQRRARDTLTEELIPDAPVEVTLQELTVNEPSSLGRRREVRTLAARSSLHVGRFEPFVQSLSDTDQSRAWKDHIDSLRTAMAVSPSVALQVREAFENWRGEEAADDLMEMIRGYSAEEIGLTREEQQNGALVTLLKWMDSDSLDYRVLASYNLNQITGTRNLADYQPSAESRQRERSLRRLWQRFESNELLPAAP